MILQQIKKILVFSYGAVNIIRNKPHFIVYQDNSEFNILDGGTLILQQIKKNILVLSFGAVNIIRNKPHFIVYQENSKFNILDGGTLISPPNRKNIYEIVLF